MLKLPRRARFAPLTLAVLGLAAFAAPASAVPCETCEEPPPDPNTPPEAVLVVSTDTPHRNQTITLTNQSFDEDGDTLTVSWDLDGNGQYGEAAGQHSVQKSWDSLGTKTIGLRVSDGSATRTATEVITVVNRVPSSSFTASKTNPLTNEAVTLTSTAGDPDNDPLSYAWDLDNDGQFDDATGATVQHAFAVPGSYPIRLRVADDFGGSAVSQPVTINVQNRVPQAAIAFGPSTPLTGETVTFESAGSSDPDGSITARAWDLDGDGEFDDASGETATRAFATPGEHVVRLQVTDDRGATATRSVALDVANRPPSASFSFAPVAPVAGQVVTFDAGASSDPEGPLSHAWDLDGNGSYETVTGASPQVTATYANAGTFTVALRVTDAHGSAAGTTRTVVVAPKPAVEQKPGDQQPAEQKPAEQKPAEQERLSVPVSAKWAVSKKKGTKVSRLTIGPVPAGASLDVTCTGKGCSFAKKTFAAGTHKVAKQFKKRLKAGAVITITVSKPGAVSQVTRYTVQRKGKPKLG